MRRGWLETNPRHQSWDDSSTGRATALQAEDAGSIPARSTSLRSRASFRWRAGSATVSLRCGHLAQRWTRLRRDVDPAHAGGGVERVVAPKWRDLVADAGRHQRFALALILVAPGAVRGVHRFALRGIGRARRLAQRR